MIQFDFENAKCTLLLDQVTSDTPEVTKFLRALIGDCLKTPDGRYWPNVEDRFLEYFAGAGDVRITLYEEPEEVDLPDGASY